MNNDKPASIEEVMEFLDKLDGTIKTAVKALTGFSDEQIEELGGFSEHSS